MTVAMPKRLPRRYWLAGAHVPQAVPGRAAGEANVALLIDAGRIAAVADAPSGDAPVIDLDGATVFPAFVDPHTHLDKGDLLAAGLAPERDLIDAVQRVRNDYARWTADELRLRIDFALRTAYAHGTRAMNSYCDWPVPDGPPAWPVLREARDAWRGRIDLTITSLAAIDELAGPGRGTTIARTVASGGGALGWFVYPGAPIDLLPQAFDLAARHDLALDFHVDEHLDPPVANLAHIARLARERGYGARTICGHACSAGVLPPHAMASLLDDVADSGLALVALPFTNLHLQDNGLDPAGRRRTPRRRGLLPVHEARARGIPLAFGSDNHRDPFFPAGDLDPLQALGLAALAAQLDDPVGDWSDTITTTPARLLGCAWDGLLRLGAPADLVVHPGRNSAEVMARMSSGRIVIRAGRRIAVDPPDFRELDTLRRSRPGPAP